MMAKMGWKKRLAIVLSLLWFVFAMAISASEQENSLGIFVGLGILPLSFAWGIAWVWIGYRNQKSSNGSHAVGQSIPDVRHKSEFRKIRAMNIIGAVGLSVVGVALFFNKMPDQSPAVLFAIVLMYILLISVPAGTAWALSDSGSEKFRVVMRRANWTLIMFWLLGSVGATLVPTQNANQIWSMVGGAFMFALPAWLNIRALRSSALDQTTSTPNEKLGNKWLYAGFLISSLVALAIYVGLIIRAAVIQGDVAYAFGSAIIPSIIAYAAISMRKSPSQNIDLVSGVAVALLISLGGVNTWKDIFAAQEIAEVVQKNLDDTEQLLEQISNPAPTTVSESTDKSMAQLATATPSRQLTKSEQLDFFSIFVKEVVERDASLNQAYMEELAKINLDAMWEPSNLFSIKGLQENQQKLDAYMKLVDVMTNDYYSEIKLQDERVLSAAGQAILEDVRQGRAKNQTDTLAIFTLERGNIDNIKRLFSFLGNQLRQGIVEYQEGQPLFASQSDVETYNSLMNRIITTQKQIEDLQKKIILSRQQAIKTLKKIGDRY